MTSTISILPPEIKQYFDHYLLVKPGNLRDNTVILWCLYYYIKNRLMKKAHHDPRWLAKCEKLEKEFLDLYERAIVKEENTKEKNENKTKEPFYRIAGFDRSNETIFKRLRFKSYSTASDSRKTYDIHKIQH
jgi:hypothetical protein